MIKFQDGLDNGWTGVLDSEKVKGKSTLNWIDGREDAIGEGDIAVVQKQFSIYIKASSFPLGLTKAFCLIEKVPTEVSSLQSIHHSPQLEHPSG